MHRQSQFGCLVVLGAVLAISTPSRASQGNQAPQAPNAAHVSPVRRIPTGGLEDRIRVFAQALNLNATQQGQLRKILLEQRESVRRIWTDRTLTPAERAPATKAASNATSEKIRAILNDEQKKKYNSAPPQAAQEPLNTSTLDQWLQVHPQ